MTEPLDLVVGGGTLVAPDAMRAGDVGIRNGRIVALGDLSLTPSHDRIDARGLYVFPGAIDTQVHFREPGLTHKEDLESGTRAALCGGVTAVLEMPNTNPATTSAEALADKLARARGRAWCHYGFFVGASRDNVDQLPELERMPGTPGVKIFMGSSTGTLLVEDDETLERVLRHGSRRVAVHSEDESRLRERRAAYVAGELDLPEGPSAHPFVRDPEAARLSTERLIALSERTGRPVHILHISTLDELPLIAEAKSRGLPVTCEVTPQHLWFAAPECYDRLGTRVQMNPPIRSGRHREAIRGALRDGLFDVFGSDHAPHTIEEKVLPYPAAPSGMPGVQTILPVLLTLALRDALFEPTLIAEMLGRRAADLFGIAGKGRIELGADADLAIVDPGTFVVEDSWLQSKCGWSPYSGETLHGRPVHVVLSGRPALRDGALVGSPRGEQLTFGDASYP